MSKNTRYLREALNKARQLNAAEMWALFEHYREGRPLSRVARRLGLGRDTLTTLSQAKPSKVPQRVALLAMLADDMQRLDNKTLLEAAIRAQDGNLDNGDLKALFADWISGHTQPQAAAMLGMGTRTLTYLLAGRQSVMSHRTFLLAMLAIDPHGTGWRTP